jgi:preprotein translocase subunit YajC
MIFQIAFIIVAVGIFITLFAVLEILFLDYFLQQGAKSKRSENVQNTFDNLQKNDYIKNTFNNNRRNQ